MSTSTPTFRPLTIDPNGGESHLTATLKRPRALMSAGSGGSVAEPASGPAEDDGLTAAAAPQAARHAASTVPTARATRRLIREGTVSLQRASFAGTEAL